MPSALHVPPSPNSRTSEIKLAKEGLIVDSRAIGLNERSKFYRFECTISGDVLTVTRVDVDEDHGHDHDHDSGWRSPLYFRIYDPSVEPVPNLDLDLNDAKTYWYFGLEYESVPLGVEEVIIDPSVLVIRHNAMRDCKYMKRCIMGDNVKRIEPYAFARCHSLTHMILSRSLLFIGWCAFDDCHSMKGCIYVPPTVEEIEGEAFRDCKGLEFLVLTSSSDTMNMEECMGHFIVMGCDKLLTNCDAQYDGYRVMNNYRVNRWLRHRYDDLPLHKLCLNPHVSAAMIHTFVQEYGTASAYRTDKDCENQTPLHILITTTAGTSSSSSSARSGHSNIDAILACLDANPGALFTKDTKGLTPLDYLWMDGDVELIVLLMQDMCIHRRRLTYG